MKFPEFMWFSRNWSCCRKSLFCCSSDVILSESVPVYCIPKIVYTYGTCQNKVNVAQRSYGVAQQQLYRSMNVWLPQQSRSTICSTAVFAAQYGRSCSVVRLQLYCSTAVVVGQYDCSCIVVRLQLYRSTAVVLLQETGPTSTPGLCEYCGCYAVTIA